MTKRDRRKFKKANPQRNSKLPHRAGIGCKPPGSAGMGCTVCALPTGQEERAQAGLEAPPMARAVVSSGSSSHATLGSSGLISMGISARPCATFRTLAAPTPRPAVQTGVPDVNSNLAAASTEQGCSGAGNGSRALYPCLEVCAPRASGQRPVLFSPGQALAPGRAFLTAPAAAGLWGTRPCACRSIRPLSW